MTYHYHIYRPSGNDTALVEGLVLDPAERKRINDAILAKHSNVEQVGFLSMDNETSLPQLLMSGGEFCGNATRVAAYHLLGGKEGDFKLRVYDGSLVLSVGFDKQKNQAWTEMPTIGTHLRKIPEGYEVEMLGITHYVVTELPIPEENKIKTSALEILAKYDSEKDCVGVTFWNPDEKRIAPVVQVKSINTLFYETACGSGTMAIAMAKYGQSQKPVNLDVVQPSGQVISVQFDGEQGRISGQVEELGSGSVE